MANGLENGDRELGQLFCYYRSCKNTDYATLRLYYMENENDVIVYQMSSLVPRLSRNANIYCLHNFNVRVLERGSLGTRLGINNEGIS